MLIRNVLQIDAAAVIMTPRVLTATRWATVPMAVLAAVVALRVPQTGILLTLAFDLLLASLVVPFVLGLYWSRGGAAAAWAAILIGIGVRMTFFVLTPTIYGVDNTLFYIPNEWVGPGADGWTTLLAGAVSLAAYLVVAAFTEKRAAPVEVEPDAQPAPAVLTTAQP